MKNIFTALKSKAYLLTFLLLSLFCTTQLSLAQIPGSLDSFFNPMDSINVEGANNIVYCSALQADGKILIGGSFTAYNGVIRNRITRLNADGTLDKDFNPGGANGPVRSIAIQPDGKILIGGTFDHFHGIAINGIVRLNTDGSLDTDFNTELNGSVLSIVVQPDGKVLIAGSFTSYNDTSRNRIARLNADGSLDTDFDPGSGADLAIYCMALQPDGKIMIGGSFIVYNGAARYRIARLNADGSLDTDFDPGLGANISVDCIALQSDGKILIGGGFSSYNGVSINDIARLNADGSLDTDFESGVPSFSVVNSIVLRLDGKILIGGNFSSYSGINRSCLAQLNEDGSLDIDYNLFIGADRTIYSIVIQPDGKILIGGDFTVFNYINRVRITRLNNDGSLDLDFNLGNGANSSVRSIAVQPDGKILIGGIFTTYNGTNLNRIARLNVDGSLDTDFNPGTGADGHVQSIVVQPDGKILIGGDFTSYNGVSINHVARLNADGSLDTDFDPGTGANSVVYDMALQPDDKILICGNFTTYNGTSINRIARLNSDGSLDTDFDPGTGANTWVYSIALQPDGKILIGGNFTSYNGVDRTRIARLNTDGSLDTDFDPDTGANSIVYSIAIQSDGKILIGGSFISYNGVTRNKIAQLNDDGSLDTEFIYSKGANNKVVKIVIQLDGKILIGGDFTTFNSTVKSRFARLNADGTLDTDFNNVGANNTVQSIALMPNGKVLIVGNFSACSGIVRNQIARINNCVDLPPTVLSPVSECDGSYTWDGTVYEESGTYFKTYTSATGCDSVVSLEITILDPSPLTVLPPVSECNSYTWEGTLYEESGTYFKSYTNVAGCDSVVSLEITIEGDGSVTPSTNSSSATVDNSSVSYFDSDCNVIAQVSSTANLGNVNVEAVVDATEGLSFGQPYLKRHYEITAEYPGGATVVLYFTADEFNSYNANNDTFPDIAVDGSNLLITAFHSPAGSGGDGPDGHLRDAGTVEILPSTTYWNEVLQRWEVTITTAGFSGFYAHTNMDGKPLEIRLGQLSATNQGQQHLISWNTLTETEGDYFILERSVDGRSFEQLTSVKSKGTASQYQYFDVQPYGGTTFYRLMMSDKNNVNTEYSSIVKAILNSSFQIIASPNPTDKKLRIDIKGKVGNDAQISLTDISGRILQNIQVKDTKVEISLDHYPSGTYIIKYRDDINEQQLKVIKK